MQLNVLHRETTSQTRLPPWLKRTLLGGAELLRTREIVAESGVATVCQEARCPNLNECWSKRHATFMILGDRCTRRCGFCAVATAKPDPADADEPRRLANAVARLDLRHVVITAVARDDMPDEGAAHFAECVRRIRQRMPETVIEVLPADFHAREDCLRRVCGARPDIYNHNIETVRRLTPVVRSRHASFDQSLAVFRRVRAMQPDVYTKSGLMVGLGETHDELLETLRELRAADVDILTIGQYLRPSADHLPVARYYEPGEFDDLAATARQLGFASVASGPFVRSSYNADSIYAAIDRRRTDRTDLDNAVSTGETSA